MSENQLNLVGDQNMDNGNSFDPIEALRSGLVATELERSSIRTRADHKTQSVRVSITLQKNNQQNKASIYIVISGDVKKALGGDRINLAVINKYLFLQVAQDGSLKWSAGKGGKPSRVKATVCGAIKDKNIKEHHVAQKECEYKLETIDNVKTLIISAEHLFTGAF